MIIPNKITSYKKSVLSKLPLLLEVLSHSDKTLAELWQEIQNYFEDINEFILTIDVAFVLGVIEYVKEKQVVTYVKADTM